MKVMQPKEQGMAIMKKRAKPMPKWMVFFMNNGQLGHDAGQPQSVRDQFPITTQCMPRSRRTRRRP